MQACDLTGAWWSLFRTWLGSSEISFLSVLYFLEARRSCWCKTVNGNVARKKRKWVPDSTYLRYSSSKLIGRCLVKCILGACWTAVAQFDQYMHMHCPAGLEADWDVCTVCMRWSTLVCTFHMKVQLPYHFQLSYTEMTESPIQCIRLFWARDVPPA